MILRGRYLSPFTRRVAVTLKHYGMDFEHRPLAVADPEQFKEVHAKNRIGRVPSLELDDGTVLIESAAILDWLDEQAGRRRLTPAKGEARRDVMQACGLITGIMERVVLAFYEAARRPEDKRWPENGTKLEGLAADGMAALDAQIAANGGEFVTGAKLTQADISATVLWEFVKAARPHLQDGDKYPALSALARRLGRKRIFIDTRI